MADPNRGMKLEFDDADSALAVIEQQLEMVRAGGDADYPLLLDALDFLTDVLETDLEGARARELIGELEREQVLLRQSASAFTQVVEDVCEGTILPRDLLEERGQDYLRVQRRVRAGAERR
jgi:hypothetical protein